MSKQDNLTDFLTDVADAIREKKGSTEKINPQNFSEEIKNLPSGASPFAVDFGEEIATGNPAYIGALQEDIDYYNEVQRRRAAGEVTDAELRLDLDFRKRIAWLSSPSQFEILLLGYRNIPFVNLREFRFPNYSFNGNYAFQDCCKVEYIEYSVAHDNWTNMFKGCGCLKSYKLHGNIMPVNTGGMFNGCYSLQEDINFDCSKVTNAQNMFLGCFNLSNVDLTFPSLKGNLNAFFQDCKCKMVRIDMPYVTGLYSSFRALYCESIYLNIPSVVTNNYSLFYGSSNNIFLKDAYISGLQVSMPLGAAPNVTMESVKYILDNCQAREDGASYTLTLHTDVLARFMAKCTEGSDDYDAEYAASLASANEKGLTLA